METVLYFKKDTINIFKNKNKKPQKNPKRTQ